MRLSIIKDERGKWRGIALVWDGPLNLNLYSGRGRLLAVMLDYAYRNGVPPVAVGPNTPRELLPTCEECRIQKAEVWCKNCGRYVCVACLALANVHNTCRLVSLAVKRAERIATGVS